MEMTFKEFLVQAKTKIDLLAIALDSASHGLTVQSHPRAQANIAMADKKLSKLRLFYNRLENSAAIDMKPEDVAVFEEFLNREIAVAQGYLSGANDVVKTDKPWAIGLLLLLAAIVLLLFGFVFAGTSQAQTKAYTFDQIQQGYRAIQKQLEADVESAEIKPLLARIKTLSVSFNENTAKGVQVLNQDSGFSAETEAKMKAIEADQVDVLNEVEVILGKLVFDPSLTLPLDAENAFEVSRIIDTQKANYLKVGFKLQSLWVLGELAKADPAFKSQGEQLLNESLPVQNKLYLVRQFDSTLQLYKSVEKQIAFEQWQRKEKVTTESLFHTRSGAVRRILNVSALHEKNGKK